MTKKKTNEKPLTLAPVKFEDAVRAALETKAEKHPTRKVKGPKGR